MQGAKSNRTPPPKEGETSLQAEKSPKQGKGLQNRPTIIFFQASKSWLLCNRAKLPFVLAAGDDEPPRHDDGRHTQLPPAVPAVHAVQFR